MNETPYIQHTEKECYQFTIRQRNFEEDLKESGLTKEQAKSLRVADFNFRYVKNKQEQQKLITFIKRHEWLGTIAQFTTHWFGVYYKDTLAGVILMGMPNAFSKVLGERTRTLERLISRGACISWSPKNLASHFMMWCINYMVQNTPYRVFSAYSDPLANELGTIYQACNFYYVGNKSGATSYYINPYTGKKVSDRFFRTRSAYKKYAQELGIEWQKNWNDDQIMLWNNIPKDIELKLKEFSKKKQQEATKIKVPSKHKYVYVLGKSKKETKMFRKQFLELNKVYSYPMVRGA